MRRGRIALELLAMATLLVVVDRHYGDGTAFAAVNPNPLWLPVLVMALAYGSTAGLLAAAGAVLYWLTAPHRPIGLDEDPFHYLLGRSLPPLMWVATAVIAGELSSLRRQRIAGLRSYVAYLERELATATAAYHDARLFGRTLKVRITADEAGVPTAIDAAARLMAAVDRDAAATPLARVIALDAGCDDFTLYLPVGAAWRGFTRGTAAGTRVDALSGGLAQAVIDAGGCLSLNDPGADAAGLAAIGVLAVAARDAQARVRGILIFHHLPPERFSSRGLIDVAAVAGRLGALLAAAPALGARHDHVDVAA